MESNSKETWDGFDVLSGVEVIVNTIKEERDSEKLLWKICGRVLDIFHVDRAWLLFPCDPRSPSWKVPVERAVAEFPGANIQGLTVDMTPDVAAIFQTALDRGLPVIYGPGGLPLAENTKSFQVKSQLSMAILPRTGKPWQFGIHQCSYERIWKETEIRLFQIIGIMTAEALGNLLLFYELEQRTAELSNLAEKLFTVQEQERSTLARELHDEVGQTLTAIKTDAVCIRENCSGCCPDVGESVAGIL